MSNVSTFALGLLLLSGLFVMIVGPVALYDYIQRRPARKAARKAARQLRELVAGSVAEAVAAKTATYRGDNVWADVITAPAEYSPDMSWELDRNCAAYAVYTDRSVLVADISSPHGGFFASHLDAWPEPRMLVQGR